MNKSLPLDRVTTDGSTTITSPPMDVLNPPEPVPKRDLLKIMRRVDKALQGLSAKERNIVLEYLKRNDS